MQYVVITIILATVLLLISLSAERKNRISIVYPAKYLKETVLSNTSIMFKKWENSVNITDLLEHLITNVTVYSGISEEYLINKVIEIHDECVDNVEVDHKYAKIWKLKMIKYIENVYYEYDVRIMGCGEQPF